jgi:YVTN family beta-propeller protein
MLLLYGLFFLSLAGCDGGGNGEEVPPPPPDLSGVWAGTWSGTDPVAGQVTGNWEANIAQTADGVNGFAIISGDVDCKDGALAGGLNPDGVPAGTLSRSPCLQNSWVMTALDLPGRSASGGWTQPGSGSVGTFTGTQIAKPDGPRIAFFSPPGGGPGTVVTVEGSAFDPVSANNFLSFNGAAAPITAQTNTTTLVTRVPPEASSGPLYLTTPQEMAISPRFFNTHVAYPIPYLNATIPLFFHPEGVAIGPDGRRAYVANRESGSISMIDTATDHVFASTTLVTAVAGAAVQGLAVTPDGREVYADYYDGTTGDDSGASHLVLRFFSARGDRHKSGGDPFLRCQHGKRYHHRHKDQRSRR